VASTTVKELSIAGGRLRLVQLADVYVARHDIPQSEELEAYRMLAFEGWKFRSMVYLRQRLADVTTVFSRWSVVRRSFLTWSRAAGDCRQGAHDAASDTEMKLTIDC
jgi:hypothetical protein